MSRRPLVAVAVLAALAAVSAGCSRNGGSAPAGKPAVAVDVLRVEPGFSNDTRKLLHGWGYVIAGDEDEEDALLLGATESIAYENGYYFGAAETRRAGAAAIGYSKGRTRN